MLYIVTTVGQCFEVGSQSARIVKFHHDDVHSLSAVNSDCLISSNLSHLNLAEKIFK